MAKKMSKDELMQMALAATAANVSTSRTGSGRKTYLDRFVESLLDEDGNPAEPKTRTQIIAEISLDICIEKREAAIANGEPVEPFAITAEGDTDDDAEFQEVNKKVKAQVASAVANNQNSTSLSFNPKYKDVWQVVKDGAFVSLAPVEETED